MCMYNVNYDGESVTSIAKGNKKMGKIPSVSLLPGAHPLRLKNGEILTDIKGTCTGCCENCCEENCYAINYAKYHHNSCIPAYAKNTLLARHEMERYFNDIQKYIDGQKKNKVTVFRFHVSGEIPSVMYLKRMMQFAEDNPTIQFYCYTKRFNWIERYIHENGSLPKNFIALMSIWHKNYDNPFHLPEFIYDDGVEPDVSALPHCRAVDKNGKETGVTCEECGMCYHSKKNSKIAVYAH